MRVYRVKSHWMDDERLHQPSMDVIERDKGWVETGLLDQHGNKLMSSHQIEPIGFVTDFTKPSLSEPQPRIKKRR